MKKNIMTFVITTALTLSTAMTSMAAYIVAPPEGWEGGTMEGFIWEQEEIKRWEDRLVSTYAENIKATTPENSVERFNAVIKAVADYNKNIDLKDAEGNVLDTVRAHKLHGSESYEFEADALSSDTMTKYVHVLGQAVGLATSNYYGNYYDSSAMITTCNINGTVYWCDVWMYDYTKDAQWLATPNQLAGYQTNEQRAAEHKQWLLDNPEVAAPSTDSFGRVWTVR